MKQRKHCNQSTQSNKPAKGISGLITSTTGVLASLILCAAIGLLAPTTTYADNISLSIDTTSIALDIAPHTSAGEFAESSKATISVSTTSESGYTLSIASSTGSTSLTGTSSSFTSISSATSKSDFSSSTNTALNNQWGYKPSQYVTMSGDTPTTHDNTGNNAVFKPLPDDSGEILAVTDTANATDTEDTYTLSIGARANSSTPIGSYTSDAFIIAAVANSSVLPCDSTKLCVEYDGNGLMFDEEPLNRVNYNSTTTQSEITKILHSDNVGDDGIATGNSATNTDQTKEATVDGASSVNVALYYDTEGVSYDWVALYAGADSVPSSSNDATMGSNGNLTGKLGGNKSGYTTSYTTWNMWNNSGNAINSDTIKIHFRTDDTAGSYISYGYYAVITSTGTAVKRTVASGEYVAPTSTNAIFHGWSSTQTTAGGGLPSQVEYADEAAVMSGMPGSEGGTKTLYAVWQQGQTITFNMDSNVSSIEVLSSDGATAGIITASGKSLVLAQGDTYTLKPTHATVYTTESIAITSGAGTISGKSFTVGAGAATISITSRLLSPMQGFDCSSLANIGDTEEVYDTRDNTVYLIGKLADNKCWMLDNLALDLANSTVLSGMAQDNTNASNTTLGYLKNGGGTASDQYATAAVANWTSSDSYSAPLVNLTNKDVVPTDAISTVGGYKVGGYYNYCAASAGSYCYGDGTSEGTSSGNATEDICPKGWRMPTGNTSGEYQVLYSNSNYNTYANYRAALRLPLSGGFTSGSASYQGDSGYFWSSTRDDNYVMYDLYLNTSYVYPSSGSYRNDGSSMRCILGS